MLVGVHGEMQSVIGVWLSSRRTSYADVCGVIPEIGIQSFWRALGVLREGPEGTLHRQLSEEGIGLYAPAFPVLSGLEEMHVDLSWIDAAKIPDLLREIEVGRASCDDPWGQAVFDALHKCAVKAMTESAGLMISPCW